MDAVTLGFLVEQVRNSGFGRQGAVKRLDGLTHRGKDFAPAFVRIQRSFLAAERKRFASEEGWAPLAPDYRARKARRGLDARTMRATGELERALTSGRGPGAVAEISRTEATFGTDLPRAVYAQRGSGTRRRRVLVIDRRRRTTWTRMIRDHLMGGAK